MPEKLRLGTPSAHLRHTFGTLPHDTRCELALGPLQTWRSDAETRFRRMHLRSTPFANTPPARGCPSASVAQDYERFPTLLSVPTAATAQLRIAEQAYRARFSRGTEPPSILITKTSWMATRPTRDSWSNLAKALSK